MSGERRRSEIAFSTPDRIVVRGHDLAGELLGRVSLGDVAFLELMARLPTPQESTVFNAIVVALVEHGLTPSALAARLTLHGAPESLQGAVAAGLLGMGDRFGGPVEGAARMLQEAGGRTAAEIVAELKAARRPVPGLGHPIHKPVDPRTPVLFRIARENGFGGPHVALMEQIGEAAGLPVNATGAIGAIACELGIPWRACRGIALMARAIGLVAHLQEEMENPIAPQVWRDLESAEGER